MFKHIFLAIGCWFLGTLLVKGQSLTLQKCYELATSNYPAIKNMDLVEKSAAYSISNINKKLLPQFNINGQATYQSQVVDYGALFGEEAGSMGITPPRFSKDNYRIQAQVDQLLYDGGDTRRQNEIIKANARLQQQNIAIVLYQIKDRINHIFFSIFLFDASLNLNKIKLDNLQTQLAKTEAAYKFGTAYLSDVNELKAEIESTKSTSLDYKGDRLALLRMLSEFIGKKIDSSGELVKPEPVISAGKIDRPELGMYNLLKELFNAQREQLNSSYLPTVNAFFQGAYGRPTLNPLSNNFGGWYLTGIRLNWSLGSLYTLKNRRDLYQLQSLTADVDRATFLKNLKIEMVQQDESVKKYAAMIEQDQKVIGLRESVVQSAAAQLAGGVITIHEYIQKLNNEHAARQQLAMHQMLLLQAEYNLKFTSGN